jgi:S-DNA-T family DNA segregation ATPase FtsK/SpoIIIE
LQIRIGSLNGRSLVTTNEEQDPGLLSMTPLVVPLRSVGTLGIKGEIAISRAAARCALLQAASLHGPDELKIVALLNDEAIDDWDFLRWLPHLRPDLDEPDLAIAVGNGPITEALVEVEKQLNDRADLMADQPGDSPPPSPELLVLVDAAEKVNDPRFLTLFSTGPKVGVYSLIVDALRLPDGCQATLDLDVPGSAIFEQTGQTPVSSVLADGIDKVRADRSARSLARLRPARRGGHEVPKSVRLLDLLGLPDPTGEQIAKRWAVSVTDPERKGVRGIIGHDGTGVVDLVLSQDIPNMLVAGAPGTGKSEFLLTLVAGLAADQGPDDVRFVIIGFKGIQDFAILRRLPHTLDVVGNLDARSFDRAMRMLENEIKRREIVLEAAGVGNIDAYRSQRLSGDSRAQRPLPRLIVIADEFAELKNNAPEQYARLESLTRLGRALGMHLVLATQSPSGVVSGQMEATVPLRISFKLIGLALSREVIGDSAAGLLPMTAKGRAFMAGQGGGIVEAQMARVGGRRPSAATEEPVLEVYPESLADTARPQRSTNGPTVDPPDEEKDLWGVVEACRSAAVDRFDPLAIPWAGPLPDAITLAEIWELGGSAAAVGLVDDPDVVTEENWAASETPIQRPYSLQLGCGHYCWFGASGSGRSTALTTSAFSLALAHPSVHMYGIDNTSGGLSLMETIPNCGGVAQRDHQLSRRILEHLRDEVARRYELFRTAHVANIGEFRGTSGDREPDLVLIVDRLDSLSAEARSSESTASAALANLALLQKLLSEGAAAGLTVVASSGPALPNGALMDLIRHRLVLRLTSRDDYGAFGFSTSKISDEMIQESPAGRALIPGTGQELQVAVAGSPERSEQRETILRMRDDRTAPERLAHIRELPAELCWSDFEPATTLEHVPVGVGDELTPIYVNLKSDGPLLVAGPRKSGRSTTLASLYRLLHAAGIKVGVAADGRSGLRQALCGTGIEIWEPSNRPEDRYREVDAIIIDDADFLLKIKDTDLQLAWTSLFTDRNTGVIVAATIDSVVDAPGHIATSLTSGNRLFLRPADRYHAMDLLGLNHTTVDAVLGEYPPGRGAAIFDHELHQPIHVPRWPHPE